MKSSNLNPRHQSNRRRAAVAVMTAATLVVLLIFASFAVDLGFVGAVCGDMQHTADAGALAGASALVDSDGDDTDSVKTRAVDVIERMMKSQGFDALDDQIIELGTWDFASREFTSSEGTTRKPYAVRVVGVRNKTPLFFAAIMGKYSTDVTREAIALASGPCHGVWGLEGVKSGSINTDSYNSTEGPYVADSAYENGDICSGRDITTGGSFDIRGDVMPGWAHTVNGSSGEITGYTSRNSGDVPSVPVDLSYVMYNNDNALIPSKTTKGTKTFKSPGYIQLSGGEHLTLQAGTYYLESLSLSGGSTLSTNGAVTIYFSGFVDCTGGGIENTGHNPHDLTMISAGTAFKLGSGAAIYATVLAPNAEVVLGSGADFYGILVGKTLDLKGNIKIHVDESLPYFINAPEASLVK